MSSDEERNETSHAATLTHQNNLVRAYYRRKYRKDHSKKMDCAKCNKRMDYSNAPKPDKRKYRSTTEESNRETNRSPRATVEVFEKLRNNEIGRNISFLLDTVATDSVISRRLCKKLNLVPKANDDIRIIDASGNKMPLYGTVQLFIKTEKEKVGIKFLVIKTNGEDAILGFSDLQQLKLIPWDFPNMNSAGHKDNNADTDSDKDLELDDLEPWPELI